MNSSVGRFYSDLRQLKEGKLSIFLGAGSSYDFGIPTMGEMAKMLIEELQKNRSEIFDEKASLVLKSITGLSSENSKGDGKKQKYNIRWNIIKTRGRQTV